MFATFSHFLSYGASDQQTARDLAPDYDGLVVPGTVASFHRDGTGGFVLSLSALPNAPEYVIDPRFPLFQQRLPKVKRAHQSLAEVMGDPSLATGTSEPTPDDFPASRIDLISKSWASFNASYKGSNSKKFDKYAARLGETVEAADSKGPRYVLPPYFMAGDMSDPWWGISKLLFDSTSGHVGSAAQCRRVVASKGVNGLASLLSDIQDTEVVIWVSNFEEANRQEDDLRRYASTVQAAASEGKSLFALYGGFFSVLLSAFGLVGSSHGIGFSENRDWQELPSSGAAPPRFYVPRLHRYMQPDEADLLFSADPGLVECSCPECFGRSPVELDYHQLMRHSVRCRAQEIQEWVGLAPVPMADRLTTETDEFYDRLSYAGLPPRLTASVRRHRQPLERWAQVLRTA